jgi:hypothetical protein
VKATKARFYLWRGEKARALQYAKEVIAAEDAYSHGPIFTLANEVSMAGLSTSTPDLVMTPEHIFAVHNTALQGFLSPLFVSFGGLTQARQAIRDGFEATLHPNDIRSREPRNWEDKLNKQSQEKEYMFKKYLASETEIVQVIPLIRLAEMYLIAIECAPLAEANELLRTYRISRNMESLVDGSLSDEGAVYQRLEREYRKEFYGEGQMFFFYKRHRTSFYSWPLPFAVNVSKYKFPKPINQIIYE